jgi:hypothetical protein
MEEVEGTLHDGDEVIVSGVTMLVDTEGVRADGSGWHAHIALPLGLPVVPASGLWVEIADGRSGAVALLDAPADEGDREVYVFEGTGPLLPAVAEG